MSAIEIGFLRSADSQFRPLPADDNVGENFDPYLQRMAAFWQATLGRHRLDPAIT